MRKPRPRAAPRPATAARKHPRQARAQVTVDAILTAAAQILVAEGPDALNTNRIAERAGVSVGSLYQYFPSKAAVVGALVEARLAEDERVFLGLLEHSVDRPIPERLEALIAAAARRQYEGAPLLARLFALLSVVEREQVVRDAVARVAALLEAVVALSPDVRAELLDPERRATAVFVATRATQGALNAAAVECPERLLSPAFVADLARMVRAVVWG
jgi:AcrR family transcriptional regulator